MADLEIPGYDVGEPIARGGFATVHGGRARTTGEPVAIKLAHASHAAAAELFRRESNALAALRGTQAAPALFGRGALDDGRPYLVMERLSCPTLAEYLAGHERCMPAHERAACIDAIVSAVAVVHDRGLIHRDLKPDNIFVEPGEEWSAKVVDFGLVTDGAGSRAPSQDTTGWAGAGTAAYMAPEQCSGQRTIGPAADLYALGVILFELITGRVPFVGVEAEVRWAHLRRRPPRPSAFADATEQVDAIVTRCLAKSASSRYPSAHALRAALRRVRLDGPARQRSRPGTGPAAGPDPREERRRMALVMFRTAQDIGAAKQVLERLGGELAHVSGDRGVAVFEPGALRNPVERAFAAAQQALRSGACTGVGVHFDSVSLRRRRSRVRYRSPLFFEDAWYPHADVLVSRRVAELMPDAAFEPVDDSAHYLRWIERRDEPGTPTVLRTGSRTLVGRGELLAELVDDAGAAMRDGTPSLVTLLGDTGYGKSHVCAALDETLRQDVRPGAVLAIRATRPVEGGIQPTLGLLIRAVLGDDCGDASSARAALERQLPDADELWPIVGAALELVSPEAAELRRLRAAPGVLHSASVRVAGELLRRRAEREPLCVVIDDLHFADSATLDALEFATRGDAGIPLWIAATARPSFRSARPAWGTRAGSHVMRELPPLTSAAGAELCRRLLLPAESVPARAVDRLVERTGGVPLLLEELVRGLKRDGVLRRSPKRGTWYVATEALERLPDVPLVEWLAESELGSLAPELAAHARLLALLGPETTAAAVEGLAVELERAEGPRFTLDPDTLVEGLVEHGLLVRRRDGRIAFRNSMLREALASAIPVADRVAVHAAAAEYCRRGQADRLTQVARLAYHAAASGQHGEAADAYIRLADRMAARHAYVEAEGLYHRALHLVMTDDDRYVAAVRGRGLMRYRIGRYEDALEDLGTARTHAERRADWNELAHIVLDESTALDWMHDFAASRERAEAAAALMDRTTDSLARARLAMAMGRSHWRFSEFDQAVSWLDQAAGAAEQLDDAGYETLVVALLLLATVPDVQQSLEELEQRYERILSLCSERGDHLHVIATLTNRFNLWMGTKQLGAATADQHRALELARELGLADHEYVCEYNLSEMLYLAGSLDEAWPHVRRCRELEDHHFAGTMRPLAALLETRMHLYGGDLDATRAGVEALRAVQRDAWEQGRVELAFLPSEQTLLAMADLATRDASPDEWAELSALAQRVGKEQEHIEIVEAHGLALIRCGRRDDGVARLHEALALVAAAPHVIEDRIRSRLAEVG